jgi:hypothetical protein
MISTSVVSLRSFTSFDDTLKNLRSGLDKGPIILCYCFQQDAHYGHPQIIEVMAYEIPFGDSCIEFEL